MPLRAQSNLPSLEGLGPCWLTVLSEMLVDHMAFLYVPFSGMCTDSLQNMDLRPVKNVLLPTCLLPFAAHAFLTDHALSPYPSICPSDILRQMLCSAICLWECSTCFTTLGLPRVANNLLMNNTWMMLTPANTTRASHYFVI